MKVIVLEHPRIPSETHFNDIANTPLWSCLMAGYAVSSLRASGADVSLLDACGKKWTFFETAQILLKEAPDLLCVHTVYFWEHTEALFDFFKALRCLGFSGHITLFGFFPTLAWSAILEVASAIDSIAVGECEASLSELANRLKAGDAWRETPGVAFCRNGAARLSARRAPADNPDVFPDPEHILVPGETASILASRGCYNHCRFCPVPTFYMNGPGWRGRSPAAVAAEISRLKAKGVKDFYFVDPNFIGPGRKGKERVLELCRLIAPLHITFGMETRADDLEEELLSHLKSAGLTSLLIGIESGSPEILSCLNKGASIRKSEAAISLCRSAGIEPEIGFLMFVPDSTLSGLEENFSFLKRNHLLDRLDRTANLLSHRQIVFMGTSGYQLFKNEGRLTKTGFLGFQAVIEYRDHRVLGISEVVSAACLHVLRETGRPESPLYWEKHDDWTRARGVNDVLVSLFESLLMEANASSFLSGETGRRRLEAIDKAIAGV
ncbi:MAG: radical SAM protein [Pseudomonadota bacterium]